MEPFNFKILVVDDEEPLVRLVKRILQRDGLEIETAFSGEEALEVIERFAPDLVITDLRMPGMSGLELMEKARSSRPELDFILLTAYATVENAVQAMKQGAREYLIKPLKDPDELRVAVNRVLERRALVEANSQWKNQLAEGLPPARVIFAGMETVWEEVQTVASTTATVLLTGESGTGKSLIAKVIHALSDANGPLVDLNCAAIPENLIESELFGHEKGAFTGAVKAKKGKFEMASNGTIFLDEIGEMPPSAQSKLLRVLQDRVFERVGGTTTIKTTARVIAATNQDLEELMKSNRFREDLYYRLQVFPIHLPPLRERSGSIPVLATYLLESIAAKAGKRVAPLDQETMERLEAYQWPGNVRELHNILERAVIVARTEHVKVPPLNPVHEPERPGEAVRPAGVPELRSLKEIEKDAIANTLAQTKGHRRRAAEILGISLRTLQYKLKQYGLSKG